MLHTKTPDENGWYWIELDDEWHMAHFDAESDEQSLTACSRSHDGVMEMDDVKPEWVARWIGPLECPGGDLGSDIVEFSIANHERAQADGAVPVLRYMEDHGTSITETSITTREAFFHSFGARRDTAQLPVAVPGDQPIAHRVT